MSLLPRKCPYTPACSGSSLDEIELESMQIALTAEREVSDKLVAAFMVARDFILNGRGPLEATLDADQTNAVLSTLDDAFDDALAEVAAIRAKQK